MEMHTSYKEPTFQERYCNLCNEEYVPTGCAQLYCLACRKVKKKERMKKYHIRSKLKRALEVKLKKAMELVKINETIALAREVQITEENGAVIVTVLPKSQVKA